MKGGLIAAAAAFAGSALADGVHFPRHGHQAFHQRRHAFNAGVAEPEPEPTCDCVTRVVTVTGEPTCMYKYKPKGT